VHLFTISLSSPRMDYRLSCCWTTAVIFPFVVHYIRNVTNENETAVLMEVIYLSLRTSIYIYNRYRGHFSLQYSG
jgi:hypothetical protein